MSCACVVMRAGLIEAKVEVEAEKSQGDWGSRQGWASASGAGTIVMGIAMSQKRGRGQP